MKSVPATPDLLPDPPVFSEDELRECRETGDYTPLLFEWYKFATSLCHVVAHIQRRSPALSKIPAQHFHVLIGLLNRCSRLMLSNIALSHEGRFGETTAIVDRCIFESAAKVTWLSSEPNDENFIRFLADGLRTEIEFRTQIAANIAKRGGDVLPIEKRMLKSIENHITASELTETQIAMAKRLPDFASMFTAIGFDRLAYTVVQKIGSHHIHGTWPSLLFHYLDEDDEHPGEFGPRGHDCSTHVNQFMVVPLIVLRAVDAYLRYVMSEADHAAFHGLLKSTQDEILRLYTEGIGGDLSA